MNDTVAIIASGAIIDPVETAMFPMSSSIATTASAVGIGGMDISSWGSVSRSDLALRHDVGDREASRVVNSRTTIMPMPPPRHAVVYRMSAYLLL